MQFTNEQISHFRAYERVRSGGRYNMWDYRAIIATGLTQEQYFFVMGSYDQLSQQAQALAA